MLEAIKKTFSGKQNTGGTIMIRKASGKEEVYDPEKLRFSLTNSGASPEDAQKVLERLGVKLKSGMSTHDLYRAAFQTLSELSRPVARSYSLRRAVMELGPSGFPFEDFVAEILRAKGYECVTRQVVLGECVPHEMDVVAYNEKELVMIEAKFHNELGIKSDLKVALYIKARFDDIRENVFSYGGTDRPITGAWLITNTKFSTTAIDYGTCQNMTLIGWNYPAKGNLRDMIEEGKLHPVTCLTTLSAGEKRQLVSGGVVLCSNIKNNPQVLRQLLGQGFNESAVLNEINEL